MQAPCCILGESSLRDPARPSFSEPGSVRTCSEMCRVSPEERAILAPPAAFRAAALKSMYRMVGSPCRNQKIGHHGSDPHSSTGTGWLSHPP